jgi:hypothetical protein
MTDSYLTRQEILDFDDLIVETVDLPALDAAALIKSLTIAQLNSACWSARFSSASPLHFGRALVAASVVDEQGAPMFSATDVRIFDVAAFVEPVAAAVMRLNTPAKDAPAPAVQDTKPPMIAMTVPDWGRGCLRLRAHFMRGQVLDATTRREGPFSILAPILAESAIDAAGRPLFTRDDLPALNAKSARAMLTIGSGLARYVNQLAQLQAWISRN